VCWRGSWARELWGAESFRNCPRLYRISSTILPPRSAQHSTELPNASKTHRGTFLEPELEWCVIRMSANFIAGITNGQGDIAPRNKTCGSSSGVYVEEMEAAMGFDPSLWGKGKNESRGRNRDSVSDPGLITSRLRVTATRKFAPSDLCILDRGENAHIYLPYVRIVSSYGWRYGKSADVAFGCSFGVGRIAPRPDVHRWSVTERVATRTARWEWVPARAGVGLELKIAGFPED